MTVDFRFRIHRIGACFPDRTTVEVFVLSDGTVSGTYRNINEHDEGFVPVSFNVDPSLVFELSIPVSTERTIPVRSAAVGWLRSDVFPLFSGCWGARRRLWGGQQGDGGPCGVA